MPDVLTLDEYIVLTLMHHAPLDPEEAVVALRDLRMRLARAAELRDLTLDDDIPLEVAVQIALDTLDLERLRA